MTENQWNDEDTSETPPAQDEVPEAAEAADAELVPDSVREQITGEPGPANPELRERALDPAEAAVDVAEDPNAAGIPMDYVEGEAVATDADGNVVEPEADGDEDPSIDTEDEEPGFPEDEPDDTPEHQDDEA